MPKSRDEKLRELCKIMAAVHALADFAWPRDKTGASEMPREGELLIIDVQEQAAKALGLPLEGMSLMTGDPLIDL